MLDTIPGFEKAIRENPGLLHKRPTDAVNVRGLYCPECGRVMTMRTECLWAPGHSGQIAVALTDDTREVKTEDGRSYNRGNLNTGILLKLCCPSLYSLKCVHCESEFVEVLYNGPSGPSLAVLASCYGGLTTPNTPEGVQYYLDQAHRCQSVGAYSAAMAMYRAALEHVLFGFEYKDPTLGAKLRQLKKAIDEGGAPKWTGGLDPEFLTAMNNLGNGAIHPNNGEVSQQAILDGQTIDVVKATFVYILDVIYEREHERTKALKTLSDAAQALKSADSPVGGTQAS